MSKDTIFALSSAAGQAGVAVIRISGDEVLNVFQKLTHKDAPKPRFAEYNRIYDGNEIIDNVITLYFQNPNSFTGEDVLEIQCHGSRAVIHKILQILSDFKNCRLAEAGEFTRRAVYNNKMDLTSAEGLIDLIHADTQAQRAWAVRQMGGELQKIYDAWRLDLINSMAYLEAFIDFPEEEIPSEKMLEIDDKIHELLHKIALHLDDKGRGESLKNGFQIAIVGAPNVGKSSLLNALAKKDVAIVSETAGTTRDIVEVYLDIAGYPVVIADTAGLRQTDEQIEKEGIKRALKRVEDASLVIAMGLAENAPILDEQTQKACLNHDNVLLVWNKVDKGQGDVSSGIPVSVKNEQGMDELWQAITEKVVETMGSSSEVMLTRLRYKTALKECGEALGRALNETELELKAEELRLAARSLGKITGIVSTEDLLDVIFSSFCIGK
ncbi:MAG: tRNA uridine-5-carboxymethylaminomethyl(34) synthesis GTPase MnmE [Alphaproteobacteria bacterium]|nr:tRNA uridine-5-carboxymethylaminomethyl(34) synthesis GTPase MnmE [Alphaproteobacteria bacterium]